MTTAHKLPYDLHDPSDLGRFTHVIPSTLADSEHEVLVEADSDSDIPGLNTRKDRDFSNVPENGLKKGKDHKKKASTNNILNEYIVHDLLDQNKVLTNQNKALTRRVELLDPFPVMLPAPEVSFEDFHGPMSDIPPYPSTEPFVPDLTVPVKRKTKGSKDYKVLTQEKELWDVLTRLLRVLEAAAAPSTAGPSAVKYKSWDYNYDNDPFNTACDPTASPEEIMLAISKSAFMSQLADAERKSGLNQKGKKYGKKAKSETKTGRFVSFDKVDLPTWAWKALGLLQTFLLVFVMIQLSLAGGDVFSVFKKSPKNSSWLKL
jgi:hypothetical protein